MGSGDARCRMDVCLVLNGMLEKLCSNGSIRQHLAKVSSMDVSMVDLTVSATGTAQRQLAEHLGHSTVVSRTVFVLVLLVQSSEALVFPSEQVSQLLLLALRMFRESISHCHHCKGELLEIPASILGRLSRSTATVLPMTACTTLCLYMAVTAPAVIGFGARMCGIIRDSCCVASTDGRITAISKDPSWLPGQKICILSYSGAQHYVAIRDSPLAAAQCPLQLSSLRSMRLGAQHQRVVRKWFVARPFCASPTAPIIDSVLQSAFTSAEAARDWKNAAAKAADRHCSLATRTSCRDEMMKLLPNCRSQVVQQVLDKALVPQPALDHAFHGIYALCSPKWGKCYVGAFGFKRPRQPMERWKEHMDRCRLWASSTSATRYAGRCPQLYAAMAAVGAENVVMVIIGSTTPASLAQQERFYIKQFTPVFNVASVGDDPFLHQQAARVLGAATCDDILSLGDRVLRKAKPRMSASSWTALVVGSASAGDRTMAARLARQARLCHPQLKKLRALPRLTLPCPAPNAIVSRLQGLMRAQMLTLPHFDRSVHFFPTLRLGKMCWSRSPMVDAVLAPSAPNLDEIGCCRCSTWIGPRINGHLITREWWNLPPCRRLAELCGSQSMAQRTYPSPQRAAEVMHGRFKRWLRVAGFAAEDADVAATSFARCVKEEFEAWFQRLPQMLFRSNVALQRRLAAKHGLIFVRIDRNPGRVVALCVEAWKGINSSVFQKSPRYIATTTPIAAKDDGFTSRTKQAFRRALQEAGPSMDFAAAPKATRPQAYWTIKQKSIIETAAPNARVRPIIAHSRHPCRFPLRMSGRALSLLVQAALPLVRAKRPQHVPMWQLHSGSREWLARLASRPNIAAVSEFDVEDCFLNTPREEVVGAVEFWLLVVPRRTRGQLYFAISKDHKAADHVGRSSSVHFWELSAGQLLAIIKWELGSNDDFEAVADNKIVVFKQHRGLPIGGHLSAALCELVALKREFLSWPPELSARPTARYRDNFFVGFDSSPSPSQNTHLAEVLSLQLGMPVKWVSSGSSFRCLELRVGLNAGVAPRVVVAFRTDPDRQGESQDVTSWPPRWDPRARLVLDSLLQGLASKLRLYRVPGTGGFTAAIRQALSFLKNRCYPKRWWVRPFALALLRNGAPAGCLPRLLRKAVG